jgi:hypothetical protein
MPEDTHHRRKLLLVRIPEIQEKRLLRQQYGLMSASPENKVEQRRSSCFAFATDYLGLIRWPHVCSSNNLEDCNSPTFKASNERVLPELTLLRQRFSGHVQSRWQVAPLMGSIEAHYLVDFGLSITMSSVHLVYSDLPIRDSRNEAR